MTTETTKLIEFAGNCKVGLFYGNENNPQFRLLSSLGFNTLETSWQLNRNFLTGKENTRQEKISRVASEMRWWFSNHQRDTKEWINLEELNETHWWYNHYKELFGIDAGEVDWQFVAEKVFGNELHDNEIFPPHFEAEAEDNTETETETENNADNGEAKNRIELRFSKAVWRTDDERMAKAIMYRFFEKFGSLKSQDPEKILMYLASQDNKEKYKTFIEETIKHDSFGQWYAKVLYGGNSIEFTSYMQYRKLKVEYTQDWDWVITIDYTRYPTQNHAYYLGGAETIFRVILVSEDDEDGEDGDNKQVVAELRNFSCWDAHNWVSQYAKEKGYAYTPPKFYRLHVPVGDMEVVLA